MIFDFDGTIVDSAPAILSSFQDVLATHGLEPQVAVDSRLIGPPLKPTLKRISGLDDETIITKLADAFRSHYDSTGAFSTSAYPEIKDSLIGLAEAGCRLHIATNKRIRPTRLILDHLGLTGYFETVYAIDSRNPPYNNKVETMAALIRDQHLPPRQACYIGDKPEDGVAADANGLDFLAVAWGYGAWKEVDLPAHWRLLLDPKQLMSFGEQ